jgi:hypothetical protein
MPRMKRTHTYPDSNPDHADPLADLIRSVLATPGLPPALSTALEVLSDRQRVKPLDILQSGAMAELIYCLRQDYDETTASIAEHHHLAAKQRGLKLRLLTLFCGLLLPDIKSDLAADLLDLLCRLLGRAASGGGGDRRAEAAAVGPTSGGSGKLRPEEQHLVLSLLGVFLARCADRIGERLGEVLGYLAVLASIHSSGQEGVNLVPTNLPHLHFTPTAAEGGSGKKGESSSSCPETSESDYSDSDMTSGERDYRQTGSSLVERTALVCLNTIVKKCPKKDVVSFWFVFLPDRCFCPLNAGVADLLVHPVKRVRQLAVAILVGRLAERIIKIAYGPLLVNTNVADPCRLNTDPDPRIRNVLLPIPLFFYLNYVPNFIAYCLLKVHLHPFSDMTSYLLRSQKPVEIKRFLLVGVRIWIRKARILMDPMDPDPEYWYR